jgi:hypothetical protein
MLRNSHNLADDKCGDTHLLISEMGEKMLRHEQNHELEKESMEQTQEEINQMKIARVPKRIYVDPKWYRQYAEVRKKQRFLPKDWYLGYGNQNNRASLSRRSTLGGRRRSSAQRTLLSATSATSATSAASAASAASATSAASAASANNNNNNNGTNGTNKAKNDPKNNGKNGATTKSTSSKKKKHKQLPVERPTRFSNRGGRGKALPNYKEHDR